MTATLPAQTRGNLPDGRGRLPTPPRDRRPALAGLALLLILAGALASALIVYRSGDRTDVLIARQDIPPGHLLTAADVTTTRVASDDMKGLIPASNLGGFLQTTTTTAIPADTLLNRTMFYGNDTLPAKSQVIGVVLTPQQRPADPIESGDVVRAFLVSNEDNALTGGTPGQQLLPAVRVVSATSGGSGADSQTVSLLVPEANGSDVIKAAVLGQVALAKLPDATTPLIDLKSGS